MRRVFPQSSPSTDIGCPLPPPLTDREWTAVVQTFGLPAQQERIVRLLMQSKRDKQIAEALDLAVATVRSHLERIYARAGVADRMELVHRVYAVAIAAWPGNSSPQS